MPAGRDNDTAMGNAWEALRSRFDLARTTLAGRSSQCGGLPGMPQRFNRHLKRRGALAARPTSELQTAAI
jgi:hypothetical protein